MLWSSKLCINWRNAPGDKHYFCRKASRLENFEKVPPHGFLDILWHHGVREVPGYVEIIPTSLPELPNLSRTLKTCKQNNDLYPMCFQTEVIQKFELVGLDLRFQLLGDHLQAIRVVAYAESVVEVGHTQIFRLKAKAEKNRIYNITHVKMCFPSYSGDI